MMRQFTSSRNAIFALSALLLTTFSVLAQTTNPLGPCGTQSGRSPWLKAYQAEPHLHYKGGDTTLYVAMTIHIVGTDQGTGYYSQATLLSALCTLNELFAPSDIQFFIEGDINYLDNSAYYNHETVDEGAQMMFDNNRPNTMNVYFVQGPAGNCGYNLPYAGIANAISCSSPDDVTWAHEVGHALSLPHPFLGWEGGVSWDGSVDHNFGNPAPERVTYNYTSFQQTYFPPDTLIIDTTFVEKMDRSNCRFAADGFCDTPPDYLARRWSCNGNGTSSTIQTDPDGTTFTSEGSFVMNYANDACQSRFSEEQIEAMRAFLIEERSSWVRSEGYDDIITTPIDIIAPLADDTPPANATELSWTSTPNASGYLAQVSRLSNFSGSATQTFVTTDTSVLLPELIVDRTYYWRVRPFNNIDGCTDFTTRSSFLTSDFVSNVQENIGIDSWWIAPQPAKSGQILRLHIDAIQDWQGQLQLIAVDGRTLFQQTIQLASGSQQQIVPTHALPAGLYVIRLANNNGAVSQKLVITD